MPQPTKPEDEVAPATGEVSEQFDEDVFDKAFDEDETTATKTAAESGEKGAKSEQPEGEEISAEKKPDATAEAGEAPSDGKAKAKEGTAKGKDGDATAEGAEAGGKEAEGKEEAEGGEGGEEGAKKDQDKAGDEESEGESAEKKAGDEEELTALQKAEKRGTERAAEEEQRAREALLGEVEKEHPDVRDVLKDPKFYEWLTRQPQAIRDAALGGNAADGIEVISKYKSAGKVDGAPGKKASALIEDLGDLEIDLGADKSIHLSKFLKEYEEVGPVIAAIADKISEAKIAAAIKEIEGRTAASTTQIQKQMAELSYWGDVLEQHTDAKKIVKSKKFVAAPIKKDGAK